MAGASAIWAIPLECMPLHYAWVSMAGEAFEFETRPDWGDTWDNPSIATSNSLIQKLLTRFEPLGVSAYTCEESSKRIHGGPP
jgi:hypothetical protein